MRTTKHYANDKGITSLGWEDKSWIDQELDGAYFQDVRLGKRLRTLLGLMSNGIGQTIPLACQDWANTKAAYRFFSNDRISEEEILRGHFAATSQRRSAIDGPVLVLHDTSEFSYTRSADCPIGLLNRRGHNLNGTKMKRDHTVRGLLMHSSMVVTTDGLPLGLAAIKLWTRKKFKGTDALKRKINPTRIPIERKESIRWLENLRQSTTLLNRPAACVHIGDRESDIYELFCLAQELDTKFLVRTCVDRLAEEGVTTVADVMKNAPIRGLHTIEVKDRSGKAHQAVLQIKFERIPVRPPIGKQNRYPELSLTIIHATETSKPRGRERIEWKLITNLEVRSLGDALEKLEWYAMRWKIETFHKILKSGCRAEESKLRSSEGLAKILCVFCILSWRVFWMSMVQRTDPSANPAVAITPDEKTVLDKLFPQDRSQGMPLKEYLSRIAQLGGYLARRNDPPPGNLVMWRGLARLTDIQLGFLMGRGDVGN